MVVDDEPLLRTGMQHILRAEPDIDVPVTCEGWEAVAAAEQHRPDVVLLDIRMPRVDGLSVLAGLRGQADPPVVAMLTTFSADEDIAAALRGGAAGFLLKDTAPQELTHAVRLLAAGGTVLSPTAADTVRHGFLNSVARAPQKAGHGGAGGGEAAGGLTQRERDVLALLAEGLSNAEIGKRLLISSSTAKDHVSAILTKLGLANRIQAAVYAHRHAVIPDSPAPVSV
ncbi:response regulator [Streptomyces sp. GS7]|uniref:response regulator n=1 Tax=Streptomyces sp. GS7 TaxID=2692234 RepID=UPI001317E9FA|nr:response regulator transcription factor [Streptomyces sp. GS7]QHC24902.1 response regulator [Streptomyces sp. GS7]